jgi:ABC-type glycerol-3-phosphate transport system substrate-binding protein
MNLRTLALAAAGSLLLAACGDSPTADLTPQQPQTNTVPASAQANITAWAAYTASLPASDSAEPVDVNGATPPVSDTEEARPI